jgi:hypothetical protein
VFLPLRRAKTLRRPNKGGYRFYNEYELPERYGGGLIRVRLTGNEEDRRRGLNRAENLRAIPPSDPDFKRLYGRRNDAESNNRTVNDTLYGKRAHSVGAAGQDLDMLGYALLSNARVHARLKELALSGRPRNPPTPVHFPSAKGCPDSPLATAATGGCLRSSPIEVR